MKRSTLIILIALNVLWAGTYSATKSLMAHAPFFLITSMRYFIAVFPLLALAYWRRGPAMKGADMLRCALMGLATFTLCPLALYAGVGLSRAADAAVITSTEPLIISMGTYFYLREKIDRRTGIALFVAFLGALVLSEVWTQSRTINPLGTLLIFMGVAFEATYSVIGKKLLLRHPPLQVAACSMAFACVVNAVALTALGMWSGISGLNGSDWVVLVLYLSLLCTLIGYTFWFVALKDVSTAQVAITIFTQPAFGILIAWAWVGETPKAAQLAGALVITAAVAVALMRPRK